MRIIGTRYKEIRERESGIESKGREIEIGKRRSNE